VDRYSDYDSFARVYNRHWGTHFIPLVLPILENHLLKHLPDKAMILDLCCGTGQLARLLADRGYRLTGIDGSGEMLRFARENAPSAEFILADARSFKLPDIYHAVISTFDSLNHIMTLEELTDVFRNVYDTLCQGGLFLFDLNMSAGFKTNWHDEFNIIEEDNVCVLRSRYNPDEKTAQFIATIFYQDNGWQRSDLTLTQKCYSEEEVLSALEKAGFAEIHSYACDILRSLIELTDDAERAFFICRKLQH
jgi:SAM-dependent methyltransferase